MLQDLIQYNQIVLLSCYGRTEIPLNDIDAIILFGVPTCIMIGLYPRNIQAGTSGGQQCRSDAAADVKQASRIGLYLQQRLYYYLSVTAITFALIYMPLKIVF